MEIAVIKNIIRDTVVQHQTFVNATKEGKRYYRGETDILYDDKDSDIEDNPLRNANNRISTNWHSLLVDQKAAYLFTFPPTFDTEDDSINKKIAEALGDGFSKFCKDICVNAANAGVAWAFVWNDDEGRQYAAVESEQISPLYSRDLKQRLIAVLRIYSGLDEVGNAYKYYEYWTDAECHAYQSPEGKTYENLEESNLFTDINLSTGDERETNVMRHDFGEVPFIAFYNNNLRRGDLKKVKKYIDVYDKVFSGFINDLEDIQQVILILTNYDGTDKFEFLRDLKRYKTIQNPEPSK